MTQDSEQRDGRWARLAGLSGGLVAVAALAILVFYCTSLYELLPAALTQSNPVKPNTALCLLLLGLTVVTNSGDQTTSRRLSTLLLLPPLIIALATLWEYASGWDAGIDGLLVAGRSWDHPVRMLPSTAVCLGLLSAALLLPRDATAAARSALLMGAVGLA
ncbi:MAG: hypothetical protein HUU35_14005, partial [Armatimonadetes bacterium]|nr:hypothetical protein [Armatimonadota bacterium]